MEEVVHLLLATFFIVFYLHKCTENSLFTKKVNMNGYHTVLSEGETMNLPAVIVSTNPERCFNWGGGNIIHPFLWLSQGVMNSQLKLKGTTLLRHKSTIIDNETAATYYSKKLT